METINICASVLMYLSFFIILSLTTFNLFKTEHGGHKLIYVVLILGILSLLIFKFSPEIQEYNAEFGEAGSVVLRKGTFSDATHTTISNNSENKTEVQRVAYYSQSPFKNITFTQGNQYLTRIGGGKGNTYVIYDVNLPPQGIVTGDIVSQDPVMVAPLGDIISRDAIKQSK